MSETIYNAVSQSKHFLITGDFNTLINTSKGYPNKIYINKISVNL